MKQRMKQRAEAAEMGAVADGFASSQGTRLKPAIVRPMSSQQLRAGLSQNRVLVFFSLVITAIVFQRGQLCLPPLHRYGHVLLGVGKHRRRRPSRRLAGLPFVSS